MKKASVSTVLLMSAVTILYCANAVAAPLVENTGKGTIDWSTGDMQATGIGVPPERYLHQPARARAMAIRAARLDALRNLLETMKGVRVQSQTLVKDMAVESDLIRTTMDATVRGAHMIGKPHYMDDGSVEVVMGFNYRKTVAKTVVDQYEQKTQQASPDHAATNDTPSAVTGLVIDAVGKGLETALAPRILDENGNVIYSASMVADDKRGNVVAYDTSASDAAKLPRLGNNVMTIKALKVQDKSDVVVSNADAKKIEQAAGMAETLRQARVSFAL